MARVCVCVLPFAYSRKRHRPAIDICVFEELNVTLRKGQRRVNGWRQRWRERESFFFFLFARKNEIESSEENEKVYRLGHEELCGAILAGEKKPRRHVQRAGVCGINE